MSDPSAGLPRKGGAASVGGKPRPGDPLFREVWRKFQLRVHPDLFTQYPELASVNSTSLQKLQGILNEAKSAEGRSPEDVLKPRLERLEFFVRSGAPSAPGAAPTFLRVPFNIRIAGANCKHALADSLAQLFAACGLPTRFHWGDEYWGSTYVARPEPAGGEDEGDSGGGGGGRRRYA